MGPAMRVDRDGVRGIESTIGHTAGEAGHRREPDWGGRPMHDRLLLQEIHRSMAWP